MYEITAATAGAFFALLFIGGFWSRTPAPFVGAAPVLLVLTAAYTLTQGAYPLVFVLLVTAGLVRSRRLGHPKPHSAVFGGVFAIGLILAASGVTAFWPTIILSSILVLGDGALDAERVYTEEVPIVGYDKHGRPVEARV